MPSTAMTMTTAMSSIKVTPAMRRRRMFTKAKLDLIGLALCLGDTFIAVAKLMRPAPRGHRGPGHGLIRGLRAPGRPDRSIAVACRQAEEVDAGDRRRRAFLAFTVGVLGRGEQEHDLGRDRARELDVAVRQRLALFAVEVHDGRAIEQAHDVQPIRAQRRYARIGAGADPRPERREEHLIVERSRLGQYLLADPAAVAQLEAPTLGVLHVGRQGIGDVHEIAVDERYSTVVIRLRQLGERSEITQRVEAILMDHRVRMSTMAGPHADMDVLRG